MKLIDKIMEASQEEFRSFWKARWLVLLIILAISSLVWYISDYVHKDELAALHQRIADYEERLHLVPTKQNSFSRLTIQELMDSALDQVAKIRSLRAACDKRQRELRDQQARDIQNVTTPEERKRIQESYQKADQQIFENCMSRYRKDLKMESWLLRQEIDNRLPRKERLGYQNPREILYFEPTNLFGLEIIADDLEGHARLLSTQK